MEYLKYVVVIICISCLYSCKTITAFHVDSQYMGTESNGSKKSPFKDFDQVYDCLTKFKSNHPEKKVNLLFHKGTYTFSKGYELDGTLSNVSFVGLDKEQVFFSGGISLPIHAEMQPDKGYYRLDLSSLSGIDYGKLHNIGFGRPVINSWVELFVNGQPMHLSRWPNHGMIKLGKIIHPGSNPRNGDHRNLNAVFLYDSLRISSWKFRDDMWISGYFRYGYAHDALRIASINQEKKEITTDGPTFYGFESGSSWQQFYAYNIKEELDEKGEYYIDKTEKSLYFIPQNSTLSSLVLSQLNETMFDMHDTHNITFQNICFEYSRATLLSMVNTHNITVNNCVFRNSGSLGIIIGYGIESFNYLTHEGTGKPMRGVIGSITPHLYQNNTFNRHGGTNNKITGCSFYQLGTGAISLGGGNRLTLEPGNNTVENSVFYNNNRIEKSYRPHIEITGAGNKVIGCELYNSPSMAMLMHGNNHLIVQNYIHDVCLEVEDQGAFYYGRNPSECGTVIQHNIFANIPRIYSTCAIYNDDGAGGLIVDGNLFYNAGRYGVLLGGGSDNQYTHNIFIGMPWGFHVDNRLQTWSSSLLAKDGLFEKRLKEVNYNQKPYADVYPYLSNYIPNDGLPKRNKVEDNLFINIDKISDNKKWLEVTNNHTDSLSKDVVTTRFNPYNLSLLFQKQKDLKRSYLEILKLNK